MQIITVVGAAQGYVSNIASGIYGADVLQEKLKILDDLLCQATELASMVKGKWPNTKDE